MWLKFGLHNPKEEALFFMLQDRNFTSSAVRQRCPYCSKAQFTVDHVATRCGKLLPTQYIHRHNEVVKCIHLHILQKYNLTTNKKLRLHKVTSVIENSNARIVSDLPVHTELKISCNKPDITVFDKINNRIFLIEIGITSLDYVVSYEYEKVHKYGVLARELRAMHNMSVIIIPYVMTWDGVVTSYNSKYRS